MSGSRGRQRTPTALRYVILTAAWAIGCLGAAPGCGVRRLQAVTLPGPTCEEPDATVLLDEIVFGDPASESAHAFSGAGTLLGTGAFGRTNRRIAPGAPLVFQLAADPNQQNYVTVKLWGSDADPAVLFLSVADARVGSYGRDLPELDWNGDAPAYPERFIYVTYPLPRTSTAGKISVALKVDAVRSVPNVAAPAVAEEPLRGATRPLYGAYLHTDPFFVPPVHEARGRPPVLSIRPAPAAYPDFESAHAAVDAEVETLLGWQLHGQVWDAAVAARQVPAGIVGLFGEGVAPNQFTSARAWRDWATANTFAAHGAGLSALAVMAMIHQAPWSRYYNDPDLLTRIAAALDSLALMQGANGAFTNSTWVGAPMRSPAAGTYTEGSGTRHVGRAFVMLAQPLAAAGLLDVLVDEDDNPATGPVPRGQAWGDMFARHRNFLATPPARAPFIMYDQSQMAAFWLANEAVRVLAPGRALPRDQALATVGTAVGLAAHPSGGVAVSAKGLALEPQGSLNGSYDGRWGILALDSLCLLAEFSQDANLSAKCRDAVHALAPFLYPSDQEGFLTMRSEAAIASLITRNPGFVEYGGHAYVAGQLGDPLALRSFRLRLEHRQPLTPPGAGDAHFEENLLSYLQDLPVLKKVATSPAEAYRLPMEDGQPDFTWTDETAGNAVVRNCGDRMYLALNWRRGFTDGVADLQHARVNNIARIHLTRSDYDRIATIVMDSPFGFGRFYELEYGPYVVGMNLSADAQFDLPGFGSGDVAYELISRQRVGAATASPVPPGQTRVLYRQRQQ